MTGKSPAQSAQQSNRTSDGRYAEKAAAEPEGVALGCSDDGDGFCSVHGRDCGEYRLYLRDKDGDHPMATLTVDDFKTDDEYEFARETLGRFAPDSDVEDLVNARAKVAHAEYVRDLATRFGTGEQVPNLTSAQYLELRDNWAGRFEEGYGPEGIDLLADILHPSMEVRCVWTYADRYGFGGDSELIGRVDGGPWRSLSGSFTEYLNEGVEGQPVPQTLLDDEEWQGEADIDNAVVKTGASFAFEKRTSFAEYEAFRLPRA